MRKCRGSRLEAFADPAVSLIADVFGGSPFYEHLAAVLPHAVFCVVLPEFFFTRGRWKMTAGQPRLRDARSSTKRKPLETCETRSGGFDSCGRARG